MCSFIGKLKDHIDIFKAYTYNKINFNKQPLFKISNKSLNIGIYRGDNIDLLTPINNLKISEDEFIKYNASFGSKETSLLIYETDYGYFIKPSEYVARHEFELIFGFTGYGYNKDKVLFYPK